MKKASSVVSEDLKQVQDNAFFQVQVQSIDCAILTSSVNCLNRILTIYPKSFSTLAANP